MPLKWVKFEYLQQVKLYNIQMAGKNLSDTDCKKMLILGSLISEKICQNKLCKIYFICFPTLRIKKVKS